MLVIFLQKSFVNNILCLIIVIKEYLGDLKNEFRGYGKRSFFADLLAGVTVAAVTLPLALALGVSSGADATAGLITVIIASLLVGTLSGASSQISGLTSAMAVILMPMAFNYGLMTVLAASMLSGIILIIAGFLKAGHIISFIPKAVIAGFTSGIAVALVLTQIENLLGVTASGEVHMRLYYIFADGISPNLYSVIIGLFVMALIFAWPKKWGARVPVALLAIVFVTAAQMIFNFPVDTVGEIPKTIVHDVRLTFDSFFNIKFGVIIVPAISIAVLCMIESLMCGSAAGKMKKEKMRANRELVAQGIGNVVLPFFGGMPASAAIARTSIAVKAGAKTRLAGIFQGIVILLAVFLLGFVMSEIPLAALAGVLITVAWKMNDWVLIKYIFGRRFRSSMAAFTLTLVCTVVFDLTIAIAVGCMLSLVLYVVRTSDVDITISDFDPKRTDSGVESPNKVQVIYITGAVFFGSSERFTEKMKGATAPILLLSMRGVPSMDASGGQEILEFCQEKSKEDVKVLFCGVQPKVKRFFDRAGVSNAVGEDSFFWEAKDALRSLNGKGNNQEQNQSDLSVETTPQNIS